MSRCWVAAAADCGKTCWFGQKRRKCEEEQLRVGGSGWRGRWNPSSSSLNSVPRTQQVTGTFDNKWFSLCRIIVVRLFFTTWLSWNNYAQKDKPDPKYTSRNWPWFSPIGCRTELIVWELSSKKTWICRKWTWKPLWREEKTQMGGRHKISGCLC